MATEKLRFYISHNWGGERGVGVARTAVAKTGRQMVGILEYRQTGKHCDSEPYNCRAHEGGGVRESLKVLCAIPGSSGFIHRTMGSLLQD